MKRTIQFLSFFLVFTAMAFAQATPSQPKGASCPMSQQDCCGKDCKKCCGDDCKKCCGKDCKKCCAKCGKDASGKMSCHKKCCHGSSQEATSPAAGAESKDAQK